MQAEGTPGEGRFGVWTGNGVNYGVLIGKKQVGGMEGNSSD